ncbi:toxin, partial [Priestia sp. SIMBA_032]
QQTYRYDTAGNLLELTHVGAQSQGRVLTAAKYSNRCLPELDGRPPSEADIAAGFDANGNLLELHKGRTLAWDSRNQLVQVQPVERDSTRNDTERYCYAADGTRLRKVRTEQTSSRELTRETRYLPGLEVRRVDAEILQVIT